MQPLLITNIYIYIYIYNSNPSKLIRNRLTRKFLSKQIQLQHYKNSNRVLMQNIKVLSRAGAL